MRLTRFSRLEYAASLIGGAPGLSVLAQQLSNRSEDIDPNELIFGETGIYRLTPGGALTQVAIYRVDNDIEGDVLGALFDQHAHHGGFNGDAVVEALHHYHLVECPLLVEAALRNWPGEHAVSQQAEGRFPVRFVRGAATVLEVDDQRLKPCPACVAKLNEHRGRRGRLDGSSLLPGDILGKPFERVPLGSTAPKISCRSVPESLRTDWERIEKALLALTDYRCQDQSCGHPDLSQGENKRLMQVHYAGHDVGFGHFAQLRSVCVQCHLKEADHSYLRNRIAFHRYQQSFDLV